MPSILAAHTPKSSQLRSCIKHSQKPLIPHAFSMKPDQIKTYKHKNIKEDLKKKKRTCFIKHQETHLGAHPLPQGYCPGLAAHLPLHSLLFSSPFTQSLSFSASARSICLPCLPLFLPLSLFLSLSAQVIVPLSIPVSLSGFPPASLPASSCLYPSFSLSCLPGSPSQHCSKLAPPPFSLLSVCQSLLLSHTHENKLKFENNDNPYQQLVKIWSHQSLRHTAGDVSVVQPFESWWRFLPGPAG